jgi:electron transfer flavoprotein alpha subunit
MKKILAFIETRYNKIKRSGFEVAGVAVKFGEELKCEVEALVIGSNINDEKELGKFGIKKVIKVENQRLEKYSTTAYAKVLYEISKQRGFDTIFISATSLGKDLGPRAAAKLEAGFAADCTELKLDSGNIIATRPIYAGKAFIDIKLISEVKIFALRPNVFKSEQSFSLNPDIESVEVALTDSDFSTYVKEITVSNDKLDVAEANIIVSGGRGLRDPENFKLVENLARVLGAAVGASRAVVDAGWRPHSEQVGQTGKTVSPSLYIACGISGAIQHLAGMSSSKCIVAINKDKDAPIFQVADYGIVGDVFEIVPALTDEFKKLLTN